MFNKLEEIIKKIEGNVLSVCLDEKLMNYGNSYLCRLRFNS